MITSTDFTSAHAKPTEPGYYICLFERNNKRFFVFGEYSRKEEKLHIGNVSYDGSVLLAWVQIEDPEIIAGNL